MLSDGIGGQFSQVLSLVDSKWKEDLYKNNAERRTVLLRGLDVPTTTPAPTHSPNTGNGDGGESEEYYDYSMDEEILNIGKIPYFAFGFSSLQTS